MGGFMQIRSRWAGRFRLPALTSGASGDYHIPALRGPPAASQKGPCPRAEHFRRSTPMPRIDSYRKQAKQFVRWHRERNYSVGEKVRLIGRFRGLRDVEVLDMELPLTLAQEIVAVEAGFKDWASLKQAAEGTPPRPTKVPATGPRLTSVTPILFVRDVSAAAEFYRMKLGFAVDFLHGNPAFYGAVSRDGVCLHLRLVYQPNFVELAAQEVSLILATIEVSNVKALFAEYQARDVEF